jgi:NADH dehydrogenase [ubiquinone] 1 alpha subcomplex assembly factor 5
VDSIYQQFNDYLFDKKVDSDTLTVYYPDALTLMHHLQEMGENSSLILKRNLLSRETFIAAASIYEKMFGTEKGIPATFEMIYFIAWSPDASQPKPAKRGSATVSMKDLAKDFDTTLNIIKDE